MPGAGTPDFLVVGHVVQDLVGEGEDQWRLGGAVSYASTLAARLGLRTAVLTAASPDLPLSQLLPGVECHVVPSDKTTRIRNVYPPGEGRRQFMPQCGARLLAEHLPREWRRTPVVLLGPVAGEIDDALAASFPSALVGAGAQGWLRQTGPDTSVRPVPPAQWDAAPVLGHASALFLSDEDVLASEAPAALEHWSAMVEILAFTRGYNGADVCHRGRWRHIGAFPAQVVDLTGAGDVFAAGFLVRFRETADPWEATRFASCAASFAVEGIGIAAIPDRLQVEARLRAHPEIVAG